MALNIGFADSGPTTKALFGRHSGPHRQAGSYAFFLSSPLPLDIEVNQYAFTCGDNDSAGCGNTFPLNVASQMFRASAYDRITAILFLKRAAAKAKKMPPIAVTNTNCGHTISIPAPRNRIACAKLTK